MNMRKLEERKMYQEMKETLKVMKLRAEIVEAKYKEMYYTAGILELQNKYPQLFSEDPAILPKKDDLQNAMQDPNVVAVFQEKLEDLKKKQEEVLSKANTEEKSVTTGETESEQTTILSINENK